jgi:hypothetical protein
LIALAVCGVAVGASDAGAGVLRVGTYHGIRGQYPTVQAAVTRRVRTKRKHKHKRPRPKDKP